MVKASRTAIALIEACFSIGRLFSLAQHGTAKSDNAMATRSKLTTRWSKGFDMGRFFYYRAVRKNDFQLMSGK